MFDCISYKIRQRHVLVLMIFFAVVIGLLERNVLNIAITRMVVIPNIHTTDAPSNEPICSAPGWIMIDNQTTDMNNNQDQSLHGVKYNWTQSEQGLVLSSFFIGYVATHIPGGLLAQHFGGKHVLGLALIISAGLSMLIPMAVKFGGSTALIAIRILMGAFQGPMFPALTQILSMWIPPGERAFLISLVYSGVDVGIVCASYFSGLIMYYLSWEQTFLIFGLLAIVWFVFFVYFCYETPASHPFITVEERDYLQQELGQLERDKEQSSTPWKDILTSKAVLAFVLGMMCSDWAYYVNSTTLPKYMSDVLHFNIDDVGVYNAIPWFSTNLLSYIFGYCIDKSIVAKRISVTNARKLAVFLSSIFPAIFILAATYAECNHMLVVIFFTLSIGLNAFMPSGLLTNPMDLSPNYAGTIMSIGNAVGALCGIIAPFTVGMLTPNAYLSEWRMVFWITFTIHLIKIGIFSTWGSGKTQAWNANQREAPN